MILYKHYGIPYWILLHIVNIGPKMVW